MHMQSANVMKSEKKNNSKIIRRRHEHRVNKSVIHCRELVD